MLNLEQPLRGIYLEDMYRKRIDVLRAISDAQCITLSVILANMLNIDKNHTFTEQQLIDGYRHFFYSWLENCGGVIFGKIRL